MRLCLRLSISIAILGILFKLMHWPYGWVLLVAGIVGLAIFYSVHFYTKSPKRLFDYTKLILLISFLIHYAIRVFHLQYGYIFRLVFQATLILTIILYVKDVLIPPNSTEENTPKKRKQAINSGISYLLYGIATLGILIGAQFKILHWEFGGVTGNTLLVVGLLAVVVALLLDSKEPNS